MLEPVAWLYDHKTKAEQFIQPNRANMDPRYWTETPLYALPEPAADLVEVAAEALDEVFGEPVSYERTRAILTALAPHIAVREQAAHNAAIEAVIELTEAYLKGRPPAVDVFEHRLRALKEPR